MAEYRPLSDLFSLFLLKCGTFFLPYAAIFYLTWGSFILILPPMLELFNSSAKLVGHSGSILLPDDDEITRKLAMLFEGQCEGLGPTQAARKFGYTKQRYFQLLEQFELQGALALQSKVRGPKTNYRRTEVRSFVIGSWIQMLRLRSLPKSFSKLTILLAFAASSE
jgi:hypothetical protein